MANNFPTIKPSLNLQLARTGILPPDVTFTRASQSGGYYDGKTVVKAEENLFLNSVWAGAVTGTPGTVPTSWVFVTSGGTLTASGESIEFFAAAGERQSIGQNIAVTAGQVITVSVDVDSVVGTATAALVFIETLTTTVLTSNVRVLVSDGTGRKTASATVTTGGQLRIRIGASVEAVTADDCTVSMKSPQLEIRSAATAYTPTTPQRITRFQPKLEFAIANEPVFDHNPVTGEALGLSIFEARTNLLLRSEEFDNAAWVKSNVTVSTNQIIAPDGTLTADVIVSSSASKAQVDQRFALADSTLFTNSVYLKAKEYTTAEVTIIDKGGSQRGVVVDLIAGTITATPGSPASSSITAVGNGWFRVTVTASTLTGGTNPGSRYLFPSSAGTSVDGNGIFIWGAQLEVGAFATPYIPTVGSTVTRSADVAVMTGANFTRFYRADEGSFVCEALCRDNGGGSTTFALTIQDGTANERIALATFAPTGIQVIDGGSVVANIGVVVTTGTVNRIAGRYALNDFQAAVNGTLGVADTLGTIPVVNQARIGANAAGASTLNGNIKSLQYYPIALTSAQLQAVTA